MGSKKFFTSDKRQDNIASNLNQVIDIIQEDISGSATRRKYQTFVTGGVGPGVTSSLYQTVYDQDFTLQTANAVMDMTIGLFQDNVNSSPRQNLVTYNTGTGYVKTSNGQLIFDTKSTMMMREKVNMYRQYAKLLLGNADLPFCIDVANSRCTVELDSSGAPKVSGDIDTSKKILDACVFVNVKRLFARDRIKKETVALRVYENAPKWYDEINASDLDASNWVWDYDPEDGALLIPAVTASTYGGADSQNAQGNLFGTDISSSEQGVKIIADIGANQFTQSTASGGSWAFLKHASNINEHVGIIFYEAGIAVLNLGGSTIHDTNQWGDASSGEAGIFADADGGEGQLTVAGEQIKPVFSPRDRINGVINGMIASHHSNAASDMSEWANVSTPVAGQVMMGYATRSDGTAAGSQEDQGGPEINLNARFYPDLLISASIDDIVDHIGFTRFSSGSLTAAAFQNVTAIKSSIFFCRATASQFNGSQNSTWNDENGSWILSNTDSSAQPYTYITTVLLYDDNDEIVAIAKLNRPIEKNNQSELTIRVRLDF